MDVGTPGLRGVRDSDRHADEGVRRQECGRLIIPITNIFQLGNLVGDVYTSTARDGAEASVEVSVGTLQRAHEIIQGALDALHWSGPIRWKPHE
jgi:hypothetical protein